MERAIYHISRYLISVLSIFVFLFERAESQRTCASEEILQMQMEQNPSMRQIRNNLEEITRNSPITEREDLIIIPVVVNVLWNTPEENVSDEQIISQIDALNRDFNLLNADAFTTPIPFRPRIANIQIHFCLARRDPYGCPTTGIRRRFTDRQSFSINDDMKFQNSGGLDAWPRDEYLNIWVCNLSGALGYAQFPGGDANTDGVVIDYQAFGTIGTASSPFHLGRTATHEVGHWLNLFHIWGERGCNNSDFVDDTPNQDDENYFCPTFPTISCSNEPDGDMFMNYMDYVDDPCMVMFTQGQRARMRATFAPGAPRNAILNSTACQEDGTTTHITNNTVYRLDMNMPGDILIHSGAELIIEAGARVGMREGARILVDRNARLITRNRAVVTRAVRCNATNWLGIQVLGNSQRVQPNHNAPLTDPQQAGIVWLENGGAIEWARTGITAGGGYGPEFWGGVIWCDNATFRNNRKDVEFMKYKFSPNRSRFRNTRFLSGMPTVPSSNWEGITIWETDGIEFDNCDISSKGVGIRTYDASIKVHNGCDITSNQIGISCYATYPMSYRSVIGTTAAENNFHGNQYDVYASTATGWYGPYNPDGKFSMEVINNNFEGARYGVVLDGPSNFRIGGNKFLDVEIGVGVVNTGLNNVINQNVVACNRIEERRNIGILAVGDNKEMQFLGNDFIDGHLSARDFVLTNSLVPGNNGAIQAIQGNPLSPAGNCFSDPSNQIDILTLGQWGGATDFFTYYYQAIDPPVGCDTEPLNPGNYSKEAVYEGIFTVDCLRYGGLPSGLESPTDSDLNGRRQQLQTLAQSIHTDANARVQYYQILAEKEAILKYLVGQALEDQDFVRAESLLSGEQGKAAQWAIFGLRMARQDYAGATQLLEQLSVENSIDAQFRDIQLINLQRLQSPIGFELSAAQEAYLNSVAESYSPIRGFARGMLSLLKDRVYFPDEYDIPRERSNSAASAATDGLKIHPVPTSDQLFLTWPTLPESADAEIQVFDLLGTQRLSQTVGTEQISHILNVTNLPNGVYILTVNKKGKVIRRTKFMVQH